MTASSPNPAEQEFVDQVIARHQGRPGALLGILRGSPGPPP